MRRRHLLSLLLVSNQISAAAVRDDMAEKIRKHLFAGNPKIEFAPIVTNNIIVTKEKIKGLDGYFQSVQTFSVGSENDRRSKRGTAIVITDSLGKFAGGGIFYGGFFSNVMLWHDFNKDALPDLLVHDGYEDAYGTFLLVMKKKGQMFHLDLMYSANNGYMPAYDLDHDGTMELIVNEAPDQEFPDIGKSQISETGPHQACSFLKYDTVVASDLKAWLDTQTLRSSPFHHIKSLALQKVMGFDKGRFVDQSGRYPEFFKKLLNIVSHHMKRPLFQPEWTDFFARNPSYQSDCLTILQRTAKHYQDLLGEKNSR